MRFMNHPIVPSEDTMNYRLDLSYAGEPFYGWQRATDLPTVQGHIEQALTDCLNVHTAVAGSGRTDRGTHALGQVASVTLPAGLDTTQLQHQLNARLHPHIHIAQILQVPEDFHARESATGKRYGYRIWNHPDLPIEQKGKVWYIPGTLDIAAMQAVLPRFVGKQDFSSFAKAPNYNRASAVREVRAFSLTAQDKELYFSIEADGFLYKMVRNIIRAVVKVGEGQYTLERIDQIIAAKSRQASPGTAPASGLYLEQVFYEEKTEEKTE